MVIIFPEHTNNINAAPSFCSSTISGLYIVEFLLRQSFERTQEEGWDGEGAAIFLPAKSSSRRSTVYGILLTGCKQFLNVCVCVRTQNPPALGVRAQGGDCAIGVWPA